MATPKILRSKQQYQAALDLEKAGDQSGAIKMHQKATKTYALNVKSWNRQMILYRKSKSKEQEIALIKQAITAVKKATEEAYQSWLKENRQKANSSRELANVLGLLAPNGMPAKENDVLEKWTTRLYLLEYRLKS